MEAIVSRELIAKQAEVAAQAWVQDQRQPRPGNPFDAIEQPEHHAQWRPPSRATSRSTARAR